MALRIALIGAGIGGLAAALALSRRGFAVRVFEQADGLREVGAGIQVAPNSARVLRALGLGGELDRLGFQPQAIVVRDWDSGRELRRTPMQGAEQRYGAPYYQIHRADLLEALAAVLSDVPLGFGAPVASVSQTDDRAIVMLQDGRQEEADLVVGCDGIHSLVRRTLHGEQPARFTGTMCWRALTPVEVFPAGFVPPDMTIWMGPLGHIVIYYIRGGKFVNMVAVRRAKSWVEESWSVPSSAGELSEAFPRVNDDVRMLLDRAQNCFKWGLFDRDPLPFWSRGRITLLGDAAHPMLPFLAQGAAMAIEDSVVLARSLSESAGNVAAALKSYEAARLPRTARVQLAARAQGQIFHVMSPLARLKRRLGLVPKSDPKLLDRDWLYEYDATSAPLLAASG